MYLNKKIMFLNLIVLSLLAPALVSASQERISPMAFCENASQENVLVSRHDRTGEDSVFSRIPRFQAELNIQAGSSITLGCVPSDEYGLANYLFSCSGNDPLDLNKKVIVVINKIKTPGKTREAKVYSRLKQDRSPLGDSDLISVLKCSK